MQTEDERLQAKLQDALRFAESGRGARFIGFLDERQAALAARTAEALGGGSWQLWGGFPQAERVCFGAFPAWQQPDTAAFPVHTATAVFRTCDQLTHRDFLGALIGAGVTREVLGDILLEPGRCVFFYRAEVEQFLLTQIQKVGRVGVHLSVGAVQPLPAAHEYRDFSATVASARLDCVTAACTGLSRAKARVLLTGGGVQLNHLPAVSPDQSVAEGALLSVRGTGRFWIDALSQPTRKGKLHLEGRKFI